MPEVNRERASDAQMGLHGVLPAGTALRGYELRSVLGQGAFGITYRAHDTTLHRDVAIKEYLPTTLALREGRTTVVPRSADHAEQFAWGRERFIDEARTLAKLDRVSAIVRVFDFLEANGTAYMVMALVEGETLNKRLLRERTLTSDAVERLLYPLLEGLEEFHATRFLHRDIKPANIMLDDKGRPTLIDFGASRAAMAERSTTLTAIFTPGYAAPEQFVASARLGPWTDIYGLSATLYHAITGQIPPSAIERILKDTYEPLGTLQPPGFPATLLAGIDAGLTLHAADRPQTIAEWREMLRDDAPGEALTQAMRKPGRRAGAAGRSRRAPGAPGGPALWGATALALLVLCGGYYYAYRANAPTSVSTAAQSLTAEQLEQALAERRQADALAAEKRRLEEDAQRKADADAAAKRQAEAELEQARQARHKAEQELEQLKADIETRRQANAGQQDQAEAASRRAAEEAARQKAEAEAAALRQAEEEARKKAAAEAETKRQADEALARAQAERQRAEAEARQKAEAETAKRQADEQARQKAEAETAAKQKATTDAAAQKKAEAAENALRLEPADRQHIQVALTALGFDTRGSDGVFGSRSREMIAAWQQKAGAPATGFLDAGQRDALLSAAAAAVARFDDDARKKAGDDKRMAAEAAAPRAAPAAAASASTPAADGLWRGTYSCGVGAAVGFQAPHISPPFTIDLEMRLANGSGSSKDYLPVHLQGDTRKIVVVVDSSGSVETTVFRAKSSTKLTGRFEGNVIRASGRETVVDRECTLAMTREASPAEQAAATSALAKFNGAYSSYTGSSGAAITNSGSVKFALTLDNGRGTVTLNKAGCAPQVFAVDLSATGQVSGKGTLTCVFQQGQDIIVGPATITGHPSGERQFALELATNRGTIRAQLRAGN